MSPHFERITAWVLTPRSPVEVAIALAAPVALHILINIVLSLTASLIARLLACVLPYTLGIAAPVRPAVRRTCVCVRLDAFGAFFHRAKLLHIAVHGTVRLNISAPSAPPRPMPPDVRLGASPPVARLKRMLTRALLRLASHARVVLRNVALELEFVDNGDGTDCELVRFAPVTVELTGEKKVTTSGLAQNVDGVLCATLTVVGYAPFACAPGDCGGESADAPKRRVPCQNGLATGDGGHLELYTELAWSRSGPASLLQLRRLALSCEAPGAVVRLPARCIARIVALAAAVAPPSAAAPELPATAPADVCASLLCAHCVGARVTVDLSSIALEVSASLRGAKRPLPALVRVRATGTKLDVRVSSEASAARRHSGASSTSAERAVAQSAASAPTLALDASLASVGVAAFIGAEWNSVLALPEMRATSSIVFTRDFVTPRAARGPAWSSRSTVEVECARVVIASTDVAALTPIVRIVATVVSLARHAIPLRLRLLRREHRESEARGRAAQCGGGEGHRVAATLRLCGVQATLPLAARDAAELGIAALAISAGSVSLSVDEMVGPQLDTPLGTHLGTSLGTAHEGGTPSIGAAGSVGHVTRVVRCAAEGAEGRYVPVGALDAQAQYATAVGSSGTDASRFLRVVAASVDITVGEAPPPIVVEGLLWLHSARFFRAALAALFPVARVCVDAVHEALAPPGSFVSVAPKGVAPAGAIPVPPPVALRDAVRSLQVSVIFRRVTILTALDIEQWGGPTATDAACEPVFSAARRSGSVLRVRAEEMALGASHRDGSRNGPGYEMQPGFGITFEKLRFEEVQRGSAGGGGASPSGGSSSGSGSGGRGGGSTADAAARAHIALWEVHEGLWALCAAQQPFLSARVFMTTDIPIVPTASLSSARNNIVDVYMAGVRGRFSAARLLWVWPMIQVSLFYLPLHFMRILLTI